MPVTFNNVPVISGSLSNKQKGKKLRISDVIYMKEISSIDTVYFLMPKIDWLSFVLPVNGHSKQKGIVSHLMGLVEEQGSNFGEAKKPYTSGYQKNFHLTHPKSGERILIQARPKKPGVSFMRFEFNPASLGKKGLSFFKKSISYGFPGLLKYDDLAKEGKVTRIDIACDVLNCSISDILVRRSGENKSHAYFGIDQEIETIYLGIPKGQKNSGNYAYNKRQDLLDKGMPKQFSGIPYTRIEARIKNPKCAIMALKEIDENPFDGFQIYHPALAKTPEQAHNWTFFVDSCWHRGVEGALDVLPDPLRGNYVAALEHSAKGFWRPDKLWAAFPNALKKSGLLDLK